MVYEVVCLNTYLSNAWHTVGTIKYAKDISRGLCKLPIPNKRQTPSVKQENMPGVSLVISL